MSLGFQPRFGQAAGEYVTYRPEFPAELFERILDAVPADRRRCVMDLGAGTGNSIRPLLPCFEEAIAVEPDPLMAQKLRASGLRAQVLVATAEDVIQKPASVDLVTVAAALYWMDVSRVMANISRWLRPGGVLAVWAGGIPRAPSSADAITSQEMDQRWRRFRDSRLDLAETSQHARSADVRFHHSG